MTILTPNFSDKANGKAGQPHIVAAHEPTRTGEVPLLLGATIGQQNPARGEVLGAAPPLKVALVGTAPSSNMLAPYNDPSWKIWVCSPGNMNVVPRVDIWFELHSNLLWPEHASYGPQYVEWLKQQKFPIYMQNQKLVPNATVFPMPQLVRKFGRNFFTSSFAWMMAVAIEAGASEIALYGIDMASRDEYIQQRPGFYYFKEKAEERGIIVSAPHESDIMQPPPLYAYVDSVPMGRKLAARKKEIEGRVGPMAQQRDQLNHNITYLQGAQEDLDYMQNIWGGAMDKIVLLEAEVALRDEQIVQRDQQLQQLQFQYQQMQVQFQQQIPTAPTTPVEAAPIPRRRRHRPMQPVLEQGAAGPTESLHG